MNKIELEKVPKDKVGRIEKNGIKLEDHEEKTIRFLLKYGFNIELIRPVSIPKMNNPDILVSGAIWEIKAPTSFNENKLKKRIKKASRQASCVIFDLRNMNRDYEKAGIFLERMFDGNATIRRMIIIEKEGKVIEYYK